jgi:hypothetical protein
MRDGLLPHNYTILTFILWLVFMSVSPSGHVTCLRGGRRGSEEREGGWMCVCAWVRERPPDHV